MKEEKRYGLIVCGATFDLFHDGHKALLRQALKISEKVILGLTTDKYVKRVKRIKNPEPYSVRKQKVSDFLRSLGAEKRVRIIPIDSVYLPQAIENEPIEAIIATKDTFQGAQSVNDKLLKQGKKALSIVVFPLVKAEDGKPITSTRIRNGEIDSSGRLFVHPEWLRTTFVLPPQLRSVLRKPFGLIGDVIRDDLSSIDPCALVAVGDVTVSLLLQRGITPQISVIDFLVERKRRYHTIRELGFSHNELVISASNPPGRITPSLFQAVKEAFVKSKNKKIVITVEGEEDLAVIPIILFSPLHEHVLYGQPGKGTVFVEVTTNNKQIIASYLTRFEKT